MKQLKKKSEPVILGLYNMRVKRRGIIMIDLQQKLVKNSMIFDRKNLFQRNTKLTEEMGEFGEAIVMNDRSEMLEETIDTLLVAVSIHLDLIEDFESLNTIINNAFSEKCSYQSEKVHMAFITLTGYVGRFAEAVQKYSGVSTSAYKGKVSKEDVIVRIDRVIEQCAILIAMQTSDHDIVNEIILRKNEKWLNHARKGYLLADVNQAVYITKGSNIVTEIREHLKAMDTVNAIFIDYEQLSHRLSDLSDIESVIHIDEHYDDKKDIVMLTNVPIGVADRLVSVKTYFKIIAFVN